MRGYVPGFSQLVSLILVLITSLVLAALVIGDHLPGAHVAAFTTNPLQTRSMYVADMERGMNFYIDLYGHENELPIWSPQARGVIFHPR